MIHTLTTPNKRCSKCREEKSTADFYKHRTGLTSHCKTCLKAYKARVRSTPEHRAYIRAYNKKWQARNSVKVALWEKANGRKMSLRRKYGISEEYYRSLVLQQNGVCAICFRAPCVKRPNLYVDHDHKTNVVRGLLCHNCNVSLGLMRDDPKLLTKAALYLWRHR